MSLSLKTKGTGYQDQEIRNAVTYALSSAASQAQQRYNHYLNLCQKFEKQYGMTSADFVKAFDEGTLGDDQEFFDWFAAARGLEIWQERCEILTQVSV